MLSVFAVGQLNQTVATVADVLEFGSHPEQGGDVQGTFPGKAFSGAVNERLSDFEGQFVALVLQFDEFLDQLSPVLLGVLEYVDEPLEHVARHGGQTIDFRFDQGKIQFPRLRQQSRTLVVYRC